MKYILIFFLIFLLNISNLKGIDKINSKYSLNYALNLFKNNDYYRAITEFKRYNFFVKNKFNNDKALYYIGLSYLNGKEYDKAKNIFYSILESDNNEFIEESYMRLGDVSIEKEFENIKEHKHYDFEVANFNPDNYFHYINNYRYNGKYYDESVTKILFSYMLNFNLEKSVYFFNNIKVTRKKYRDIISDLKLDFSKIKNVPQKSEALATMLSIVIPGAGQIYAGEVKKGFIAMGVNAAFITLSILAYKNYSKFVGIFLGYYELTFYFGNINNARNAVYKYNENKKNEVRNYLINVYWKRF